MASGQRGDFSWSVVASRPSGPSGAGRLGAWRPCLQVVTTLRRSPYSYDRTKYRACTAGTDRLRATEPPLIASSTQVTKSSLAGLSTVGMIFAPGARSVRMTFADGSSTTLALREMTQAEARATGLGRLRYAAFQVRGTWCAERLISLSGSGRALWDSGADEVNCPSNASSELLSQRAR
jgi:hypothetical protein